LIVFRTPTIPTSNTGTPNLDISINSFAVWKASRTAAAFQWREAAAHWHHQTRRSVSVNATHSRNSISRLSSREQTGQPYPLDQREAPEMATTNNCVAVANKNAQIIWACWLAMNRIGEHHRTGVSWRLQGCVVLRWRKPRDRGASNLTMGAGPQEGDDLFKASADSIRARGG
jgi:hypothetical protein